MEKQRISITLDPKLLSELDAYVGAHASRSSAIEYLLRQALAGRDQTEVSTQAQAQALDRLEVLVRAVLVLLAPDREALAQAVREARSQVERLKERG